MTSNRIPPGLLIVTDKIAHGAIPFHSYLRTPSEAFWSYQSTTGVYIEVSQERKGGLVGTRWMEQARVSGVGDVEEDGADRDDHQGHQQGDVGHLELW